MTYDSKKIDGESKAALIGFISLVVGVVMTVVAALYQAAYTHTLNAKTERVEFEQCISANHTVAECRTVLFRKDDSVAKDSQ